MKYLIRGKKLVTVGSMKTIVNGTMLVENGWIKAVGTWDELRDLVSEVVDYSEYVITPSLVDCHTHLLEFAPSSLYPVTPKTHFIAGKRILFEALSAGITALGEQICGHPLCNFTVDDYRTAAQELPMDISFAATSISIGFEKLAHFTAVTQSSPVSQSDLTNALNVIKLATHSDFPGENIFLNATPANFTKEMVPRAGEIIYSLEELKAIVAIYHRHGKKIGCHVAGEEGIQLALDSGIDVLHHAHGITDVQMKQACHQRVKIVATPMGGTHLPPNSPDEIVKLVQNGIPVSIATDAYLPPYPNVTWLPFSDSSLRGPDVLMEIAQPAMKELIKHLHENDILALITANPAEVLGKGHIFGKLEPGYQANFLVAEGIPGLEITEIEDIKAVYFRGEKVINRF
jgi:predicted amidohydrolase YtcJ